MTLKECIKKHGLQTEVSEFYRWSAVDINFLHSDGSEDETQFDVMFIGTKNATEELSQLYKDFCQENHFPVNTVQSVTVIKSVPFYKNLQQKLIITY